MALRLGGIRHLQRSLLLQVSHSLRAEMLVKSVELAKTCSGFSFNFGRRHIAV